MNKVTFTKKEGTFTDDSGQSKDYISYFMNVDFHGIPYEFKIVAKGNDGKVLDTLINEERGK